MKSVAKTTEHLIIQMIAYISIELMVTFKHKDVFEILNEFSQSRTFENLWNEKTELWKESPDYIIEEYLRERNEN